MTAEDRSQRLPHTTPLLFIQVNGQDEKALINSIPDRIPQSRSLQVVGQSRTEDAPSWSGYAAAVTHYESQTNELHETIRGD